MTTALDPKTFETVSELVPGPKWGALFKRFWPQYQKWFQSEGDAARPSYGECIKQLKRYMPELVSTYELLVALSGGSDSSARFLSLYCPPAYLTGCTQAVWTGDEPILVRNYDYNAALLEGIIWQTAWNGKRVIAMSDGMWGVVDGMNESGLAVSLAFGGRLAVGKGFGIPLILRYILEFCEDTKSAVDVLRHVPTHMSYNVTIVDDLQRFVTVYVAPDRKPVVRQVPVATNHQGKIEWPRHAWATATVERENAVTSGLADCNQTATRFVASFLKPPIYNTAYERGFGTLYTAIYKPMSGVAEFRWPGVQWQHSFSDFRQQKKLINYV